jgi:hypothetical protein
MNRVSQAESKRAANKQNYSFNKNIVVENSSQLIVKHWAA